MIARCAVRTNVLFLLTALAAAFVCSCGGRAPNEGPSQSTTPVDPSGVNAPLRAFSQQITSETKSLKLKPAAVTEVPVVIRNTGQELLSSIGKFPVTVSYKWFEAGKMLPIEGERTGLPKPLMPNEVLNVNVRVVAPVSGKSLLLKITLVQEGVQWFISGGATPLEIPVTFE